MRLKAQTLFFRLFNVSVTLSNVQFELCGLTHCWEGDEPLHQQPAGRAEAAGFLDQHVQPDLKPDGKKILPERCETKHR